MLSRMLGRAYEASLAVRRRYYNNQCEFNTHIERPDHVLYFVHGFGGAPGQAELVEASIASVLGRSYHLHCMSIPALQVSLPEYLKYSPVTADKIRIRIVDDLHRLARDYDNEVILMAVSSHGMYDFVYAYPRIPDEIRHRIRLLWVACAADDYEQIRQKYRLLTRLLSWLTGFEHGGYLRYYSLNHPCVRLSIATEPEVTGSRSTGSGTSSFASGSLEWNGRLRGPWSTSATT
jgi:hypothetical protein